MHFLTWLEQSGFSTWIRESPSVWAYPTVLFMHTLGLGFLVGGSMVLDLRALGFSDRLPLEPMKKFIPLMWFGLIINALSGVVLVVIDATSMLSNPLFYIKLAFIALALVSGRLLANQVFREPGSTIVSTSSKVLAGASLVFWLAAITAGRLTAYIFSHANLALLSH